jgi:hypothetical protein
MVRGLPIHFKRASPSADGSPHVLATKIQAARRPLRGVGKAFTILSPCESGPQKLQHNQAVLNYRSRWRRLWRAGSRIAARPDRHRTCSADTCLFEAPLPVRFQKGLVSSSSEGSVLARAAVLDRKESLRGKTDALYFIGKQTGSLSVRQNSPTFGVLVCIASGNPNL